MHNTGPRVLLGHDVPSQSSKKIEIMLILSLVLSVLLSSRPLLVSLSNRSTKLSHVF